MTDTLAARIADAAEQASLLAGIFQNKGNSLRAHHIRKADKLLLSLESFFGPQLCTEAATWRRAVDAEKVLVERLGIIERQREVVDGLVGEMGELDSSLSAWRQAPETERQRIATQAKRARTYFETRVFHAESHILHRYERYQALKGLVPYADNAQFLCEAIHHFENREKYEENKERLEKRREAAAARLASVTRGFHLALAFCVLVVTIPLCAPFAWSLYRRKREVANQIANLEETVRREEKRIQAADEGVVAAQEIREVLGPVPLDVVRRTLTEVSELRREFNSPSGNASATATLVAFLDLNAERLEEMFGPVPKGTLDSFRWLAARVDDVTGAERDRLRLLAEKETAEERLARLLKGHSIGIVKASLDNVRRVARESLAFEGPEWCKADFAALAARMPSTLEGARRALWHVSHGQSIDEVVWKRLGLSLASESNLLNACALELRLGAPPEGTGIAGTDGDAPLAVV